MQSNTYSLFVDSGYQGVEPAPPYEDWHLKAASAYSAISAHIMN